MAANDKNENEVILAPVHRSLGIYLTAQEKSGKPQLGDRLLKVVRPDVAANGIPYFQIMSLASWERKKKGETERIKSERATYLASRNTSLNMS